MMFCVLPASQNAVILLHLYDNCVAWWVQSFYMLKSQRVKALNGWLVFYLGNTFTLALIFDTVVVIYIYFQTNVILFLGQQIFTLSSLK